MAARRILGLLIGAALLAACDDAPQSADSDGQPSNPRGPQIVLRGAGATFPQPLYAKWGLAYFEKTSVKLDYQARGSEAGLKAISENSIDFGASDIPLPQSELDSRKLIQFPMAIGAIVMVVHLPGIGPGQLLLSGDLIARIYLGTIRRWSDPALRELNPDLELPDQDIIPVYRADASGTTWLLSTLLSQVSPPWKQSMGSGSTLSWPVGVGAQGSAQLARFVGRFEYTLGYVQLAEAKLAGLSWTRLRNRYGQVVQPEPAAVEIAALRYISQSDRARPLAPPEQPDPRIWPLTTTSYVVLRQDSKNPARAKRLLEFFDWCLHDGASMAGALSYVPVPPALVRGIQEQWALRVRAGDEPVWILRDPSSEPATEPASPRTEDGGATDAMSGGVRPAPAPAR